MIPVLPIWNLATLPWKKKKIKEQEEELKQTENLSKEEVEDKGLLETLPEEVPEIEPPESTEVETEEPEDEAENEAEEDEESESEESEEEQPEDEDSEPELSDEESKEEEKFQEELENPSTDVEEEPEENSEEEETKPTKTIVLPPEPGQEVNEPIILEQFECKSCGKKYYIKEDDNESDSSEILCPFCEMNSTRTRRFDMIIQKYEEIK